MRAALCLALPFLALPAQAAPVTYLFTGTVDQIGTASAPGFVTLGEQVPISITVETAYPVDQSLSTPGSFVYFASGTGFPAASVIIAANIAGENTDNIFQTVTVQPGSGISLQTFGPQINFGFNLSLSGALAGELATGAIPESLNANGFTAGTFSVTNAFSPTFEGFSGTIDGLAVPGLAVPEPASLFVIASGLAALALLRRRRA